MGELVRWLVEHIGHGIYEVLGGAIAFLAAKTLHLLWHMRRTLLRLVRLARPRRQATRRMPRTTRRRTLFQTTTRSRVSVLGRRRRTDHAT